MKLENQQKPPTSSMNLSQQPSRNQKPGKQVKRPKRKYGVAEGHEKHEQKFMAQSFNRLRGEGIYQSKIHSGLFHETYTVREITYLPNFRRAFALAILRTGTNVYALAKLVGHEGINVL